MYVSLVKPSPQRGRSNRRGTFSARRRLTTYLVSRVALIRSSGHQTEVYSWGWGCAMTVEAWFMEKENRSKEDEEWIVERRNVESMGGGAFAGGEEARPALL